MKGRKSCVCMTMMNSFYQTKEGYIMGVGSWNMDIKFLCNGGESQCTDGHCLLNKLMDPFILFLLFWSHHLLLFHMIPIRLLETNCIQDSFSNVSLSDWQQVFVYIVLASRKLALISFLKRIAYVLFIFITYITAIILQHT